MPGAAVGAYFFYGSHHGSFTPSWESFPLRFAGAFQVQEKGDRTGLTPVSQNGLKDGNIELLKEMMNM